MTGELARQGSSNHSWLYKSYIERDRIGGPKQEI